MKKPIKSPTQKRSRETRKHILTAATHILVQQGYIGCTTNKIAERAGVSIGSLYQYFPNKDAIIAILIEKRSSEDVEFLRSKVKEARNLEPRAFLSFLIDASFELFSSQWRLRKVFAEQLPRTGRLKAFVEARERHVSLIEPLLSNILSQHKEIDGHHVSFIFVHSFIGVIHAAANSREHLFTNVAFKKELRRFLLDGIKI